MVKWQWRQRGSRGSHANLGPHPLHSPAGTGCNFLLPLLLRKTQKDKVGVRMRPLCCYPWLCFHLEKKRNSFTKPGPFTIYWHHITHGAPAPGVSVVPRWAQHSSIPESLSWPPSHTAGHQQPWGQKACRPAAYSVLCLSWKIMMDESQPYSEATCTLMFLLLGFVSQ